MNYIILIVPGALAALAIYALWDECTRDNS